MRYLLDNSNISESYSGVVTPLTYSFANHVYQEVYKAFCARMGVAEVAIDNEQDELANLLRLVGYHMYYDLNSWYRLVSLLPAYSLNKPLFDRMLGIQTDAYSTPQPIARYARALTHSLGQSLRIAFYFMFMGRLVQRFNREFDKTLDDANRVDLLQLDPMSLEHHYQEVSQTLLRKWWVPIANDFAVMLSTGLTAKLVARWCADAEDASHLYADARGSLVSLDPGEHLVRIIDAITHDDALCELFRSRIEPNQLLSCIRRLYSTSPTWQLIEEYLRRYGARVPGELKLESPSLADEPASLLALLRGLLDSSTPGQAPSSKFKRGASRRTREVRLNPAKRAVLHWLRSWAYASIRRREETRFRRALIFGHARNIFLALGRRLCAANLLADPRDVFLLTESELFALVEGTLDTATARTRVGSRTSEIQEWKSVEMPRRIEWDEPLDGLLERLRAKRQASTLFTTPTVLKGRVAAPSAADFVNGVALVMPEFSPSATFHDKILVARHTDPGWTIVFPFIRALVVERGGLLSHAAIVAREMGVPCIVGVDGATRVIQDGSPIQLSFSTGEVRTRLDSDCDDYIGE